MTLGFYNCHPNKDCTQAIGSKLATDGLPSRAGAAPIPAGDETTWPDGGLRCRRSLAKRPHEEEKTRAYQSVEYGMATPVALRRGGMTSPPRMKHRRELKLQGLPERANANSCRRRETPDHLLTATADQVDRSYR
jgi:hypothetical protein